MEGIGSSARRILCPAQGEGASRRAVVHAVALARRRRGAVTVLYLLPAPELAGVAAAWPIARLDLMEQRSELRRLVRPGARAHVPIELRVEEAGWEQTLEQVAAAGFDLVVLDADAWDGRGPAVPAQWARGILGRLRVPVLAVGKRCAGPPEAAGFGRILCAVDLSPGSEAVVAQAAALASESPPARLTLLHVLEGFPHQEVEAGQAGDDLGLYWRYREGYAREALAELGEAHAGPCRAAVRVASGKPWLEVLDVAAETGADLVVVGARREAGEQAGTAARVIPEATCPVLLVPLA